MDELTGKPFAELWKGSGCSSSSPPSILIGERSVVYSRSEATPGVEWGLVTGRSSSNDQLMNMFLKLSTLTCFRLTASVLT